MAGLDGRYNWYDDVDPSDATFLAGASSIHSLADGRTAVVYVGLYDRNGDAVGDVGVYASDLPNGPHTVYRVRVEDERIVALDHGPAVFEAWSDARATDRL